MNGLGSTFLEIHLPNPTTWFYQAVILGMALFFRFQRPWKLRNVDLLLLFLLVPPLLLLREGQGTQRQHEAIWRRQGMQVAELIETACVALSQPVAASPVGFAQIGAAELPPELGKKAAVQPQKTIFRAYLWLLIGSAVWLLRCLIDLALRKREPFVSNLSTGGLAWLALALFLVMSVWTFLPRVDAASQGESQSVVLEKSARFVSSLVEQHWTPSSARALQAALALTCHGLILLALFWIGMQHFGDAAAGMSAVVLYLLLPYTSYHLSDLEQAFPAAMIVLAVAAYRWPLVSGLLLGAASAVSFFPLALLPVWASFYFRRGLRRFLAFPALIALALGAGLWLDPDLQRGFAEALSRPEWQPWYYGEKPLAESLWAGLALHYAYRLPLFIGYLVLWIASIFFPAPKNLGHLIAWSLAILLGIQFWYADAGGAYVQWYLPLLVLLALKPTLLDRRPPEIEPDKDWLIRSARWLRRRLPSRRPGDEPAPIIKTLAQRKAG